MLAAQIPTTNILLKLGIYHKLQLQCFCANIYRLYVVQECVF